MTGALLHVGTAACFAGCGALLLAAHRCGRRAAALQATELPRLHVSEAEEVAVTAGTAGLKAAGLCEPFTAFEAGEADTVEFHYCPDELRVTAHALAADGSRRCWHCARIIQGEA